MAQRFYSQLDLDTFDRFNRELVGDVVNEKDGIIFQQVVVYKISVKDTKTNVYGETVGGKVFKSGVQIASLVDAEDQTTNTDEFGPDREQNVSFSFLRKTLRDIEFVVDVGDIVNWNEGFCEITSKKIYRIFMFHTLEKGAILFLNILAYTQKKKRYLLNFY